MHGEDRRRSYQDRWRPWQSDSPEGDRGAHGGSNPAKRTEDPEQRQHSPSNDRIEGELLELSRD
jgi:hypothetical protein